jgi:hypothetical protein
MASKKSVSGGGISGSLMGMKESLGNGGRKVRRVAVQ